jgi:DNA-binding response OmpR family regulator
MRKNLILIVDDNEMFVRGLRISLEEEGYDIYMAANGAVGLKMARRLLPSLIILDINMPVMDGLTMCDHIRDEVLLAHIPILMLTSNQSIDDRVSGLDVGADDYLTKPFNSREMKARVRALLRRSTPDNNNQKNEQARQVGCLKLHLETRQAEIVGQKTVQLTPAEFELIHFLMVYPNVPFTSEQLLQNVWSYEAGTADHSLVRWHIKNLRLKLEKDPKNPQLIQTLSRHGYMLHISES